MAEIDAAGLSSQERLATGREAVQQAKDHRKAGRLDEASHRYPWHSQESHLFL